MLLCALFESLYIILMTLYIKAINVKFLFIRHVQYAWMIFKTRRKSAFVDVDMLIITSELISILDHAVQIVRIDLCNPFHVRGQASMNSKENWRCPSTKPRISETLLHFLE